MISRGWQVDQNQIPDYEWYTPTSEEVSKITDTNVLHHVSKGGLLLRPLTEQQKAAHRNIRKEPFVVHRYEELIFSTVKDASQILMMLKTKPGQEEKVVVLTRDPQFVNIYKVSSIIINQPGMSAAYASSRAMEFMMLQKELEEETKCPINPVIFVEVKDEQGGSPTG
jgi:hypothetical protein